MVTSGLNLWNIKVKEVQKNGQWDRRVLLTQLPIDTENKIRELQISLNIAEDDRAYGCHPPQGGVLLVQLDIIWAEVGS